MVIRKKPFTKKILLVNRDFQLRYTRLAVLVGLGSTILTLVLILFPLFQFRILRFPNFLPMPFLIAIGIAAFLNFVMVALMGVLLTHRIAGPMFSLVRFMRRIQAGELEGSLKVRESDELKYVIRNFNELLDFLRRQALGDADRAGAIATKLMSCKGSNAAVDDALAIAADLQQTLAARASRNEVNAANSLEGEPA